MWRLNQVRAKLRSAIATHRIEDEKGESREEVNHALACYVECIRREFNVGILSDGYFPITKKKYVLVPRAVRDADTETTPPVAPPKRTYAAVATQASSAPAPPRPTTNSVSTNTDPRFQHHRHLRNPRQTASPLTPTPQSHPRHTARTRRLQASTQRRKRVKDTKQSKILHRRYLKSELHTRRSTQR